MLREKIESFVKDNPDNHTVPLLRAMLERDLSLRIVVPSATARYDVQAATTVVTIDDSAGFGPHGFHKESLAYLIGGADCLILNTAPKNTAAYELLADGPERFGRTILIETKDRLAAAWFAYLKDNKRTDCGIVGLTPDDRLH